MKAWISGEIQPRSGHDSAYLTGAFRK